MKLGSWVAALVLVAVVPRLVAAQEIVVLDGGIAGVSGTTEVDIISPDDRLEVWVYEAYLAGRLGNTVDDSGQRVCRTPCHLTLANGQYTFYVGSTELGIDAVGVPQGWQVEDSSAGSLTAGIIFTVIGGLLAITGIAALALAAEDETDDDMERTGWGTLMLYGRISMAGDNTPVAEVSGERRRRGPDGCGRADAGVPSRPRLGRPRGARKQGRRRVRCAWRYC